MAKTFEEYLKEQNKLSADQLEKEKASYNSGFDTQVKNVTDAHNLEVGKTEQEYQHDIDENEVQRYINERQIAENMANMGLTDSGLSRTQMTASQLSYANNKVKIEQKKRTAVETLKQSLLSTVSNIESDRRSTISGLESEYAANDRSNAVSLYNQQQQAAADIEAARIKAENEANQKYEDSQKVDYTALKKVTADIMTKESFLEKAKRIIPMVGSGRSSKVENQNSQPEAAKYYIDGKLYKTYNDYVLDRLNEHYTVFNTINEGTLRYLMDVYYKI